MRILIIEDETLLAEALLQILRRQKIEAEVANNGEDGLLQALSGDYDLILLDVMLPRRSGLEVVRELRQQNIATPVLLLTAKSDLADKVVGLDAGADDYLTKPFVNEELLARIRALSRRPTEMVYQELAFGDLTLRLRDRSLRQGQRETTLSQKEFDLLRLLIQRNGQLVNKEEILTRIWGLESEAGHNNVEVYVFFLRKKLDFLESQVSIITASKLGYRLEVTDKC